MKWISRMINHNELRFILKAIQCNLGYRGEEKTSTEKK